MNSSDTYYLEPISSVDPLHHSLLNAEDLPVKGGSCGHGHHSTQFHHISNLLRPFHSRVSLPDINATVVIKKKGQTAVYQVVFHISNVAINDDDK